MTGKVRVMTLTELLANNAALSDEVKRSHEALKIAQLTIDKMKVELTYLRRMARNNPPNAAYRHSTDARYPRGCRAF